MNNNRVEEWEEEKHFGCTESDCGFVGVPIGEMREKILNQQYVDCPNCRRPVIFEPINPEVVFIT